MCSVIKLAGQQVSTLLQAMICISCVQAHNEFILPSEEEGFIHRMKDIIRRAEALMRREPLEPLGPGNVLRLPYLSGVGGLSGSQVGQRSFQSVAMDQNEHEYLSCSAALLSAFGQLQSRIQQRHGV